MVYVMAVLHKIEASTFIAGMFWWYWPKKEMLHSQKMSEVGNST